MRLMFHLIKEEEIEFESINSVESMFSSEFKSVFISNAHSPSNAKAGYMCISSVDNNIPRILLTYINSDLYTFLNIFENLTNKLYYEIVNSKQKDYL